jgi:hypothetical protein
MAELLLIPVILAGAVALVAGNVWIVVNAFRTSVIWGLGTFLLPVVGLIFVLMHWEENRKPFLYSVLGTAAISAAVLLGPLELPQSP